MKLRNFLLLVVVAIFLSSFLSYKFYSVYIVEDTITLDMEIKVDDHFGLNADTDALKFGRIMPGTSAERGIEVENNASFPLKIVITNSGVFQDWISISDNYFVLDVDDRKKVLFEVTAPDNADFGNYSGKTTILFKKVFFR
ncbi:hypothetical protein ISS07_06670 [Candidatus Woesearchaeota archaeon]|nr:hypothetical protein [Candidatus Woesearchaeota archaeon]